MKKGIADSVVFVPFVVFLVAFVLLFVLVLEARSHSAGITKYNGKGVIEGQLNPVNYYYADSVLVYLRSSVSGCSKGKGFDLSYAELINLFMKGSPKASGARVSKLQDSSYEPYFNAWVECTDEFFRNSGYAYFRYLLEKDNVPVFISSDYFVGALGFIYEPRLFGTEDFVSVKIPLEGGDAVLRVRFGQ